MRVATGEREMDRLAGSAAHLTYHLATCEICALAGTRYCCEVAELAAMVRADQNPVVGHNVARAASGRRES
jgi:hypothetical protein